MGSSYNEIIQMEDLLEILTHRRYSDGIWYPNNRGT